jgi:hypothetical protein
MSEQAYPYTISTDFPGGAVNSDKLKAEIQASTIVTALERVDVNVSGDSVDIVFKEALSAGDKTILDGDVTGPAGGLIAAHDNTPNAATPDQIEVVPHMGGEQVIADGVQASLADNAWHRVELSLPEPIHLQGVKIRWKGAELGDYGWLSLVNPAGESAPQAQIAIGATTFNVGAGKGVYYDPANGGHCVEFWDNAGNLVEIAEVDSVNGDQITLKTAMVNQIETDAVTRSCVAHHTTMRGANRNEGGFRMVQNGTENFQTENEMTSAIPAGMILAARFKMASATAADREVTVNYKLRRPKA